MAHGGRVEVLRSCYKSCHARWQLGLGRAAEVQMRWGCAVCFGGGTVDFVDGLDPGEEEWESHAAVPSGQGGWVSV